MKYQIKRKIGYALVIAMLIVMIYPGELGTAAEASDGFYVEDGVAHIETSACEKIIFQCDKKPSRKFIAEDKLLTGAKLDLKDDYDYIRVTVIDKEGRRAWTNPIFIK